MIKTSDYEEGDIEQLDGSRRPSPSPPLPPVMASEPLLVLGSH